MMKMPVRGWLTLTAALTAAACSPPTLPESDSGADATPDSMSQPDVVADRTTPPDVMNRPDATPEAATEAGSDAASEASMEAGSDAASEASVEAGSDAAVEAGMDAAMDAMPDGSTGDAAVDARPDASGDGSTGLMCAAPTGNIVLPMGSVMGSITSSGGAISRLSCSSGSFSSGEHVYTLNVGTRTGVTFSTDNAGTTFDTGIAVRRVCGDISTEVACDDDGAVGSLRSYARAVLEPGTYSVIVDGYSAASGTYQLDFNSFTPAANATCATAAALTTGMTTTGSTANGGNNNSPCRSGTSTDLGGLVFYSYEVPANSRVTFALTATGAQNVRGYVTDSCAATTCAGSNTTSAMGTAVNVTASNSTAAPRTMILAVGSTSITTDAAFTVTPTVVPIPPVPPNATCATAEMLSLPATGLMGTTIGGTERRDDFFCTADTTGGALAYYSVVVPAGRTVQLRATPASMTFNPSFIAFTTCSPSSCADYADSAGAGLPETINYFNSGASDATLNFGVSSRTDDEVGAFTLDARLLPAAATNTTCAAARPLSEGVTTDQLQTTGTEMTSAMCLSTSSGPVLYYSVTVPANTRATLTARTYSDNANPVLRVRQDCATTTCVASANTGFTGGNETVNWTNTSGSPVTYLVELGSSSSVTRGVFDLNLAFSSAAPAYSLVALPSANCDDLSMGATNVTFGGTDDEASAITALPSGFTFPYFGDTMNTVTHYSVTTNGFAQLWTSGAGTPSVSASQGENALPSTLSAPGLLAAFWDDLIISSPAVVRTMVTGTAPNRRFVIEWNNATIFSRSMQEQLRFQIKLSEGSGIVEYHYCSMTSTDAMSTRHFGSSALIGLQNIPRTRGLTYLIDGTDTGMAGGMARSIGGGTAASPSLLRFIPTGM